MHAMGMRESNIDANTQLLTGKKWNRFKQEYPEWLNISFETTVDAAGNPRYQNTHLQIIQYARSKLISIENAAVELQKHHDIDVDSTIQLQTDLKSFKEGSNMIEFYDMINKFVEEERCPPLDVIFLDEAQDLSPHQWKCFDYIKSKCKRAYMAGDDDQTIYGFQGADPNCFMEQEGERDDQEISRRVPKAIHKKALEILPYINKRVNKKWYPKNEEGELIENCFLEDLDFNKGEWMILATTNKLLQDFSEHFYRKGLRIFGKGNTILPQKTLEAYRTWNKLKDGQLATVEETKNMWTCLNYNKGHIKYGYSSGKTLSGDELISLDILKKNHGLLIEGDWQQLSFDEDVKKYIKSILKSGDDLSTDPRIELSTIHGAKGRERENIVLCIDYGTETQSAMLSQKAAEDPNSTHRLFFVGVTRAMQRLYILVHH